MDIIGLCGVARSGKDTVGNILVKELGFRRIGFADGVREAYLALNPKVRIPTNWTKNHFVEITVLQTKNWDRVTTGWFMPLADAVTLFGWENLKELEEIRQGLQRMGTEAGRDIHGQDCWVNHAFNKIDKNSCQGVVFTDVRFDNEAKMIKWMNGVVWKIDRGFKPVNNHSSEAGISDVLIDAVIENRGTIEELKEKVLREYANF